VSVSSVQASTITTAITIDGNDWAQVQYADTLSALDVLSLCGDHIVGDGPCHGTTADGIDLTGWYWAMEDEVINLVSEVLGISWDGTNQNTSTSHWFDIFNITGRASIGRWTEVIYNDGQNYDDYYSGVPMLTVYDCDEVYDGCHPEDIDGGLYVKSLGTHPVIFSGGWTPAYPYGAMFHRPSEVPIPAAVWLFGTAMIGLVGFSKRRKAA